MLYKQNSTKIAAINGNAPLLTWSGVLLASKACGKLKSNIVIPGAISKNQCRRV